MKIENQSVNDKYRTTAAENSIRIQEKTPPPPNKGGKHHQIPIKIKLHVWFALFGWIACISSTILCARCTGDLWRDKKLFGIPLWYRLHQITAILGFICNSISIIVIVIQADGKLKTNIHAIIGYVSTILITIQAMTGFLKPDNQSDFRIIFNYIHWLIGTMAHSLALINILMSAIKKNKQFLWMFVSYLFIYLAFTDLLRKLDLNRLRSLSAKKIVLKTIAHYLSYFVLFTIFTLTIGMMIKIFD
ncbi:ferric-chelate reductase 1-like [Dermatophagoides farinae]|uniref:ascorbate ferrireductase (transmembrane) n=1 Tax=Dermatophagoides farinae TaxID=6954 RepID=A0A9D4SJN7_DERFA|nr:putative ferric-chelate reductase 1 homolog [Dermatophagoides farinae]KAH7643585.1 ferric-chelate reductase 1-like [Dermatophagoides farinae]